MGYDYIEYWDNNYKTNGTSGAGSYGLLAEFKAEVINALIKEHQIQRVIEFGCGDGNQLQYINYPEYLGLDVASSAVQLCAERFKEDQSKSFMLYRPGLFFNKGYFQADMTVCIDVLYHITDEHDFRCTLHDILQASTNLIVLYTKITGENIPQVICTIKDRDIFHYLAEYPEFQLKDIVPQRHTDLSSADFIILQKKSSR